MDADWNNHLKEDGLTESGRNFGRAEVELRAARDGAVVAPLIDFGVIRASGPDAATFLHNLVTNDVIGLTDSNARFAGMCTPKGRLIATMHILKAGDELLLIVPLDVLDGLHKKLSMYILRSKVKLSNASAEFAVIGTSQLNAIGGLTLEGTPYSGTIVGDARVFRLDSTRALIVAPIASALSLWTKLGLVATMVGPAAWLWLEIQAGHPRVVRTTQELFVPQMLNMENPAVAGVSFTKGCYPGQEIVARTQYLGKIKRRMFLANITDLKELGAGTAIFSSETGEQQCGSVVSIAATPDGGMNALICVQTSAAESGEINLETPGGPRPRIGQLPYQLEASST